MGRSLKEKLITWKINFYLFHDRHLALSSLCLEQDFQNFCFCYFWFLKVRRRHHRLHLTWSFWQVKLRFHLHPRFPLRMNFLHPYFQFLELRLFQQTFLPRLFLPWQRDHLRHHHLRRNRIHLNSLRHLRVPLPPPKDIDIYYKINRTIYYFSKVILMRAHFENSFIQFQIGIRDKY